MIASTNLESLGGGGHVIQNAEGVDLTQRDDLRFSGYLKASDNSTDGATVVSDEPTPITYEDWSALTPAQKAGTKWLISGMPGILSDNQAIFVLKNQSLEFSSLTAVITDSRITTSTYPLVYYSNDDVALAAGVTSAVSTGQITFTATSVPTATIVCDIVFVASAIGGGSSIALSELTDTSISSPTNGQALVYNSTTQKWENGAGGSGSSGHIIQNAAGTSMTNRGKLQFPDSLVSDDSTNDRTVVEVMQEPLSREDFEDAVSLEDGIYPITTDDSTIILSDMVKYGSGTVEQALNKAQVVKLTGTMPTYNGVITVSFPTGFDADNTVVLSAEVEMSGLWSNMYNGNLGIQTAVHSGGINVYTRVADFAGNSFRVFIRRI